MTFFDSFLNKITVKDKAAGTKTIALAGYPNVGKSTVFNNLTGMHQHTGNWTGKTVSNVQGIYRGNKYNYSIIDMPGTYSLLSSSPEERIARNYICFNNPDIVVVVCDATCLERSLNLVLQTMEITRHVIVCINLMDEAQKRNIEIDINSLRRRLGVPVTTVTAKNKKSLSNLIHILDTCIDNDDMFLPVSIMYPDVIEQALSPIETIIRIKHPEIKNSRWFSLRLLEQDFTLDNDIKTYVNEVFTNSYEINNALLESQAILAKEGINNSDDLRDTYVSSIAAQAEKAARSSVSSCAQSSVYKNRRLDKLLTSLITGYPIMILLLAFVFYLTISGANYPSRLISEYLFYLQDKLSELFVLCNAPEWLHKMLVLGVYRVLAWVVSVMLPPMAIFFPLFTLLEDAGYLPRVAFNLDKPFQRCSACGKQALSMCMGFGCNAAGVVGCRIIDSPRERLMAILTNSFVPCNGRFPTMIAIITMFLTGSVTGVLSGISSSLILTMVIVMGISMTFLVCFLLSKTILKGVPSSFTLELPPYRRPQIGKVLIRSVFDRTLFVLGRAAAIAAPAGLIIWLMANVNINNISLLSHCAEFLDPFARLMGLDGIILVAFILAFPANEIVFPIIIMAYLAQGSIMELDDLVSMKELLVKNGWTWVTAVSTLLFSLNHWPCSTTLMTIKKETGSIGWTVLAAVIPTVIGIVLCLVFTSIANLFQAATI